MRPVLLNSWEAMYYDVTLEKIEKQADLAKQLGIELFVLDDGWFRSGNDSRSSMGDWVCNEKKLPGGINTAADLIRGKGLSLGYGLNRRQSVKTVISIENIRAGHCRFRDIRQ